MNEIQKNFPGFDLEKSSLSDSIYSIPQSLYPWKGKYLSTIFLTHLHIYLCIVNRLYMSPKTILEIGGGYGALARLFKLEHPTVQYTICDLPESLFFSEIFLRVNFPNAVIQYAQSEDDFSETADFFLVPVQLVFCLKERLYDIVVNSGSLQEMPDQTVDFWMDFIETNPIKNFYSLNYFANQIEGTIAAPEASNYICPKLDPYWHILHWEQNPPLMSIDTDKNWLELCLRREPEINRNPLEKPIYAQLLYQDSFSEGRASTRWLSTLWKASWLYPMPEVLWQLFEYSVERKLRESIGYGKMLLSNKKKLSPNQQVFVETYLKNILVEK